MGFVNQKWRIVVCARTVVRSSVAATRFVGGIGDVSKLAAFLADSAPAIAAGLGFSGLAYLLRDKSKDLSLREKRALVKELEKEGARGVPGYSYYPDMGSEWHGPRGMGPYPTRKRARSDGGGDPPTMDSHPGTIGIVRRSVSRGRKVPKIARALRVLKASERSIVLCYKGLNTIEKTDGTNRGFYSLANQSEANTVGLPLGVATGDRYLPVHIYNVTAVPQGGTLTNGLFQAGSLATNVRVGFQLTMDATGSVNDSIGWTGRLGCYDHTGAVVTNPRWGVENIDDTSDLPNNATIANFGKKVYTDWVDARLMLYGKRAWDARYTIMFVKFKDDVYCPEWQTCVQLSSEGSKIDPNTDGGRRAVDFWKSYAFGLVNNPVATRPRLDVDKAFTVLYKKRVTIAAKSTDESNSNVNMVHFKCFQRLNKLLDHSRYQNITQKADGGEDLADFLNETKQNIADADVNAQPRSLKDNVYMIIQCDGYQAAPDTVAATDATFVNHGASYDLVLRKKVLLDMR